MASIITTLSTIEVEEITSVEPYRSYKLLVWLYAVVEYMKQMELSCFEYLRAEVYGKYS